MQLFSLPGGALNGGTLLGSLGKTFRASPIRDTADKKDVLHDISLHFCITPAI